MMNKLVKIGGVLIVLVALAALIGSTMTFAQDDEPAPAEPAVPGQGEGIGPGPGAVPIGPRADGFRGQRGFGFFNGEAFQAALAEALGITVEELEAAQQTAREMVLQQMVDEGQLTQAQADAILSGEGLRSVIQPLFDQEAMAAVIADALGITVEELQAAHEEGKGLRELAAELGVELEAIQEAVQTARAEAIEQAVEDGRITQEQADRLLEAPAWPGRGPGGFHGPQGPGGFRGPQGPGSFQGGASFGNQTAPATGSDL